MDNKTRMNMNIKEYSEMLRLNGYTEHADRYDELILKYEHLEKSLNEWESAALIPCDTCGGNGFNGYGTGYDAVCDGCAGNGGYMGRATPQDLIEMIAQRMNKLVETKISP